MGRAKRPRLEEWGPFADALKELVLREADLSKAKFASLLGPGFDRGLAGGILEARDPCPEQVLVRLYKASAEEERLRDVQHLQLLVDLWTKAAGTEPGPVLQAEMNKAGTPLPAQRPSPKFSARTEAVEVSKTKHRSAYWLRYVLALLCVVALVALAAVVLWPPTAVRWHTASEVNHSFPGDYAGPVHVTVAPLPGDTGRDVTVTLRWGPWSRQVLLSDLPRSGVTMQFSKTESGSSFPLAISVSSRARVGVGVGEARGPSINVDDGWTRQPR